jgi:hypothetical protein
MGAFDFRSARSSGTYTDTNGVRWSIHADPSEMLRGEWTADTEPSSRYGMTSIWGGAQELKQRIDAYAAGYAVVPPPSASTGDSSWIWIVVAAVVLMGDGRRR